jgi:3-carboxy-cis,cis-muconate cycloisomerase
MSDTGPPLYSELFGDAEVTAHLSSEAAVQAMLDVEVALVRAQAALDLIPRSAVAPVADAASAPHFDMRALAAEAARDGNVAIPLVRMLRQRVAAADASAATRVHHGATSQDIIDTGLVLQLSRAVPLIAGRLNEAGQRMRALAAAHVDTVMPGRTWLRQATPVTFGLTAAGWSDALGRASTGLRSALHAASVIQFGGATGTLAAFGKDGLRVAETLAALLGLRVPTLPWHAHRDRMASLACALGLVCGTLGKIARDVALLSQTEIGELSLALTGGSSTMPHKHNPVGCAVALAAATRAPGLAATMLSAMPQELERGLGGWQAEWEVMTELAQLTGGAARAMAATLGALEVHRDRMRANLDATGGANMSEAVSLALTPRLGRDAAHATVASAASRAASEGRPLVDVLRSLPEVMEHVGREVLEQLLDPTHYVGVAAELVERVLEIEEG